MKRLLKSKMKGIPEAEQDRIIEMFEKNPDFFQKMAVEIKAEMDKGLDQMAATMKVAEKFKSELGGLMQK